ncbi:BTAD domain-containing putative transcriptional regulator [Streptomyces sp. NPDC097619]|uniref:AfsR/SARP family transcriptional regulator n=1 Tax=Streptomyces sp. NPDC097619 TaxID=3157228 RepID=UPI0033312D49
MRYLILGATEARDDRGTALPLGGPRLRALLTALALRADRPLPVPVAELVDEVWPPDTGRPPADAPAALQALVGRLRRTLGREAVRSGPGGYRLAAAPDEVDLHRFTALAREGAADLAAGRYGPAADTLRSALGLWRGPAFADLPDGAAHRARPEAARATALRDRIEAELRAGRDPARLAAELTGLVADHPYEEPLRAQLIRALSAAGRNADALIAFESARRTLADTLGTDPGPELRALHRHLLAPAPTPAGPTPPRTGPATGEPPAPARPAPPVVPPAATAEAPPAAPAGTRAAPPAPPAPGNLRARLDSFVGREPELAALAAALGRERLVTLTGPGGSGKTRLAEEAARAYVRTRPGEGAWLVELAALEDPAAVPGAVLSALGLRSATLLARETPPSAPGTTPDPGSGPGTTPDHGPDPGSGAAAQLVEYCARRRLLLVLDNCEHLVGAAAALAEHLLVHCPGLRILATSREPLGVPGEAVRPVEPLPPDPAHRLFTARARSVRPGFDPAADSAAITEICARLDGLPLAIELAAARLRLLTPAQIAARLDDRFRLLTGGGRTRLPRQQTLRAVVDWSWDLLDAAERTLLRALSAFAGGWDLEAAEAVGGDPALLGALVDKSLVVAAPGPDGAMRYRMLETVHEYATGRAAETPHARTATARAHARHYLALAEEAEPLLRSGAQLPWIRRIESELGNLRAALHFLTATEPSEPEARRLAFALGWFWWIRNYRAEGARWTDRVLALGGPEEPEDRGHPEFWPRLRLNMLRILLYAEVSPAKVFEDDRSRAAARRILRAFAPGDSPEAARFPGMLWPFTVRLSGGPVRLRAGLDRTVDICRREGGDWELGMALMLRVHVDVDLRGGLAGVDEDLAELGALTRRVGDRWMRTQVLSAAAEAAMGRGRYREAARAYEEALELAREVEATVEAPFLLARLADISYRAGDPDGAERILAEAAAEAERYGVPDAHAIAVLLSALIAYDRGDHALARERSAPIRFEGYQGSPPPQFTTAVRVLEALLTARERGPRAALPEAVGALADAVAAHCAEDVLAGAAEAAALLLSEIAEEIGEETGVEVGEEPADRAGPSAAATAAQGWSGAVRVLAAATAWRSGHPRPVPFELRLRDLPGRARTALGPAGYEEAWSAGAPLDPAAVVELLGGAAGPGLSGSG